MNIPDAKLLTLGPWVKGINEVIDEAGLPKNTLREAVNVDLDAQGSGARRSGYTKISTTTDSNGLYAWNDYLIYANNGNLIRFDPISRQAITLVSDLALPCYMSYTPFNDVLYFTNGEQSGSIDTAWNCGPWAIPNPSRQPTCTSGGTGALPAAQYQVAITYVDSQTGRESGTGAAAVVAAAGSIQLSNIPVSDDGYAVRVYITPPNGNVFFAQTHLVHGVSSFTVYDVQQTSLALNTQFMRPMPPGQLVRAAFGRLWVARGNRLLFSGALTPGLHKPIDAYFVFRDRITVCEPLINGIWVATETQTFWLSGTNPDEMSQIFVAPSGAAEGSSRVQNDAAFTELASKYGDVAYWYSDKGCVIGLPGGQLQQFMEGVVAANFYKYGATLFREENGLQQMITTVRQQGLASRLVVTDSAGGIILRNGVVIS